MASKKETPQEPVADSKTTEAENVIIKPTTSLKASTEEVTVLKDGLTHGGKPAPVGARISLRPYQIIKLKSKGLVK